MHVALSYKHLKIAKILFEKNKEAVGKINRRGETSLHLAIRNDFTDLAIKFIQDGEKFIDFKQQDSYGNTPLHLAISCKTLNTQQGNLIISLFNANKEGINIENRSGKSSYDIGIENGHFDHIYNFIDHNEKIIEKNGSFIDFKKVYSEGNTIFHLALSNNHKDLCELLFCEKRKEIVSQIINQQNETGNTLLHFACLRDSKSAKFLMDMEGINLTCQDKDGYTALHYAVLGENKDVIIALVKKNRDLLKIRSHVYQRIYFSETPFELAKSLTNPNQEILQLLIELEKQNEKEKN